MVMFRTMRLAPTHDDKSVSTLCDTRFAGRVVPSNESEDDLFTLTSALPRYDLGQCPLNSIHLFPNHPNTLLTARMRDRIDHLYHATNLVIAIPNQGDFRGCFHSGAIGI